MATTVNRCPVLRSATAAAAAAAPTAGSFLAGLDEPTPYGMRRRGSSVGTRWPCLELASPDEEDKMRTSQQILQLTDDQIVGEYYSIAFQLGLLFCDVVDIQSNLNQQQYFKYVA